jgi:glycosyltransferase involved in cell wall biosynthesis
MDFSNSAPKITPRRDSPGVSEPDAAAQSEVVATGVSKTRLFLARKFNLEASLTQDVPTAMSEVERQMPRKKWQLQPQRQQDRYPWGRGRLRVLFTNVTGPLSGRLHYRCAAAPDHEQQICFFTDDFGRWQPVIDLPAHIIECTLVAITGEPGVDLQQVTFEQSSFIQRHAGPMLRLVLFHLRHPWVVSSKMHRAFLLLRRGGIIALKERLIKRSYYPEWIVRYDTITESDRRTMRSQIEQMEYRPCFSILLPVYNVEEIYLRQAIESVRNQVYTNWQLCIADDNSPNARVREVIKEYAERDPRIVYTFRKENGHISKATNSAAELATGEFVAFLDHDDELREHALYMMVRELQKHRDAALLFSDEDKISPEGRRHDPYFKSDWNPELLLCHNCVCHFTVVRRDLFNLVGGLRAECNGAQDWDLALRVSEHTTRDTIRHIPHILYHWRVIEGSTAKETAAKPYVTAAQIRAVSEHLARRGDRNAQVESIPELSMLRVRYTVPDPAPLVSLIIPTYNQHRLLSQCVEGILNATSYKNIELIVVDNRSDDPQTLRYLEELPGRDSRARVIRDEGAFNFARINNDAVQHARGSILGFVNNDIQIIRPDWLDEMVSNVARKDVGAVGARLLFPNGTIQHAGVITGIGGVAGHQFKTYSMNSLGYFCRAVLPQDLSAVTAACMLVHTHLFHQVGGFDQEHLAVAFNDIDLCLKVRDAGWRIVYTPYAELLHHESVSRGYEDSPEKKARFNREYKVMQDRWGAKLTSDPFYNPNFTLKGVGYDLGIPPKRFGLDRGAPAPPKKA